jgi:hypothetical protein
MKFTSLVLSAVLVVSNLVACAAADDSDIDGSQDELRGGGARATTASGLRRVGPALLAPGVPDLSVPEATRLCATGAGSAPGGVPGQCQLFMGRGGRIFADFAVKCDGTVCTGGTCLAYYGKCEIARNTMVNGTDMPCFSQCDDVYAWELAHPRMRQ